MLKSKAGKFEQSVMRILSCYSQLLGTIGDMIFFPISFLRRGDAPVSRMNCGGKSKEG